MYFHIKTKINIFFREFQPMMYALDDSFLSLDQNTNQCWYRWELNSRFLIRPSKTLSVKLIGTHN